jgi:hypothetical protein
MYVVEEYYIKVISVRHRGAMARFWTGIAPIRIETGRYEAILEAVLHGLLVMVLRTAQFSGGFEVRFHGIVPISVQYLLWIWNWGT